jgi:UDP-N-acetylmuramoyl-L-alanyl-D-glutamate--2,6-diaminopimelate ligase
MPINLPQIYPVACHTDNIGPGSTFVVIKGARENGVKYISTALAKGATRIIIPDDIVLTQEQQLEIKKYKAQVSYVKNTRLVLAQESARVLNYPAQKLKIIGITGTKGKTTTSFLLEHMLRTAGYKTALLSTVYNKILDTVLPTQLTTPHPDYLHVFFDHCVKQQIEFVVMETAAQAFSLYRLETITFSAGLFTNFSKEHGEFYSSQDDYFAAKCKLFNRLKPGALALINSDDQKINNFYIEQLQDKKTIQAKTFGFKSIDGQIAVINNSLTGLQFSLIHNGTKLFFTCPTLVGEFNAYNSAAAAETALCFGISPETIQTAFSSFKGVPGRLNLHDSIVLSNGARGLIDYAHNPASFEAVLSAVRPLTKKLIVVFGAGGDRDREKRPQMGAIASIFSDHVILTTDNSRSEDPAVIIQEIYAGISIQERHKVTIELDREAAIKRAFTLSDSQSIILLLGKGPDEYQLTNGVKTPFSERAILQSL